MFDFNLELAEQYLNEAANYHDEAQKLPNPGRFWRALQPCLSDANSDETDAEKQARIDARREELNAEVTSYLRLAADQINPIFDWLEERGIDRKRLVGRITGAITNNPTAASIRRAVTQLNGIRSMVDAKERLEIAAEEAEADLRSRAEQAAYERGCDLDLDIHYGNR